MSSLPASFSRAARHTKMGGNHWKVRFDTSLLPDITVAVRLDHANSAALDYYLLPRLDFGQPRIQPRRPEQDRVRELPL